jgi:hypothetical protein
MAIKEIQHNGQLYSQEETICIYRKKIRQKTTVIKIISKRKKKNTLYTSQELTQRAFEHFKNYYK